MLDLDIGALTRKYPLDVPSDINGGAWDSQLSARDIQLTYTLLRAFRSKRLLEFGARYGGGTRFFYQALKENDPKSVLRTFEILPPNREQAQGNLDRLFGKGKIKVDGDVIVGHKKYNEKYDAFFIDDDHDLTTTKWVFDHLLPKHAESGALVCLHDFPVVERDGKWVVGHEREGFEETEYILELRERGKLPLSKIYFTFEEGGGCQSAFFQYDDGKKT